MTKRTDIHRPSAINPDEYQFVACEHMKSDGIGDFRFMIAEREKIRVHMARTGGTYSRHEHGGNCHVCGAAAIYTCLFHHKPTNTYIRTGNECADKLDGGEAELFRKQVRAALEQVAGKRKAAALLTAAGLSVAWTIYTTPDTREEGNEEYTVRDMVGRLVQYGSLSDKQMSFLRSLCDRIANRAEMAAKRTAERESAAPVPFANDERATIRGTVLAIKHAEFMPTRMLVSHADGWKIWGTLPGCFDDSVKGKEIEFSAKIRRTDDSKFAFFSRPTKARII